MVLGLVKLVQKFVGKKLLQTIVVPQRGNFPDVDKMNDEAPREEWGVDLNNKPVGPFVRTLALKLLDASGKFNSYAFVTTSIGGGIAFGEISDKIRTIRRLKGDDLTAIITMGTIKMQSSFNKHGVPRPFFQIVQLTRLAGDRSSALPTSVPPVPLMPPITEFATGCANG